MPKTRIKKNTGFLAVSLLMQYTQKLTQHLCAKSLFPKRPLLYFSPTELVCRCHGSLNVLKTYTREMASLTIGHFTAHVTELVCTLCQKKYKSSELHKLIAPKSTFSFDIMVFIGEALFIHCCNTPTIQNQLSTRNITISLREIDYLGKRFIIYLALVHQQSQEKIRQFLKTQGGYILHLDGTCEGDSPHLMSSIDELSKIVLGNVKLPSENAIQITEFLEQFKNDYGTPIALVHDMGNAILKAVKTVFPDCPDYICHFHFLKDIGKDLLEHDYSTIRRHLKTHRIRTHLRQMIKVFKTIIDKNSSLQTELLNYLNGNLMTTKIMHEQLSDDIKVYLILSWVVEAKYQSHGFGFPFDKPHVDFYTRLTEAYPILIKTKIRLKTSSSLLKLQPISKVVKDEALKSTVVRIRQRNTIFEDLRDAMRIALPSSTDGLNNEGDADMKTIKTSMTQFRQDKILNQLALTQTVYQKMFKQIDHYWEKLFADPIEIKTLSGTQLVQPQRTNNLMEQFFRDLKRSYRKKNGNNSLTKILQTMMADTPLVKNLTNPQYMKIILDGKLELAECFADIDIKQVYNAFKHEQQTTRAYPKRMKKLFKNIKMKLKK